MNNCIVNIVENQLCSGCGTCNVVCPHDAIKMDFNVMGQLLAQVDSSKCIECGLCTNVCPSLDKNNIISDNYYENDLIGEIKSIFVGRAKDDNIYLNGQSGGAVTALLAYLIDQNIIDAAVVCKVDDSISYNSYSFIATNSKELYECQKSSYTPVDMVTALRETSKYSSVAFVGTGCCVQGVRTLQTLYPRKYSNIKLLIGLICDRVLAKTTTDILYGKAFKNSNKRIIWRDKRESYKYPTVVIRDDKGKEKSVPSWKRHSLKEFFTPPRCLICFDKLNMSADIVVGDPWGMTGVDWENGSSVILTRTDIGEQMIRETIETESIIVETADIQEFIDGQGISIKKKKLPFYLSTYNEKGWQLPSYAGEFSFTKSQSKDAASNQINRFMRDLERNKKNILFRYSFLLSKRAFKIKLYNLIHKKS